MLFRPACYIVVHKREEGRTVHYQELLRIPSLYEYINCFASVMDEESSYASLTSLFFFFYLRLEISPVSILPFSFPPCLLLEEDLAFVILSVSFFSSLGFVVAQQGKPLVLAFFPGVSLWKKCCIRNPEKKKKGNVIYC